MARRFTRAAALEALRLKKVVPESALQWGFIKRRIGAMKLYQEVQELTTVAVPGPGAGTWGSRFFGFDLDTGEAPILSPAAAYNFMKALGELALHYDVLRASGYAP